MNEVFKAMVAVFVALPTILAVCALILIIVLHVLSIVKVSSEIKSRKKIRAMAEKQAKLKLEMTELDHSDAMMYTEKGE